MFSISKIFIVFGKKNISKKIHFVYPIYVVSKATWDLTQTLRN